jgi:hypothetical protein
VNWHTVSCSRLTKEFQLTVLQHHKKKVRYISSQKLGRSHPLVLQLQRKVATNEERAQEICFNERIYRINPIDATTTTPIIILYYIMINSRMMMKDFFLNRIRRTEIKNDCL